MTTGRKVRIMHSSVNGDAVIEVVDYDLGRPSYSRVGTVSAPNERGERQARTGYNGPIVMDAPSAVYPMAIALLGLWGVEHPEVNILDLMGSEWAASRG